MEHKENTIFEAASSIISNAGGMAAKFKKMIGAYRAEAKKTAVQYDPNIDESPSYLCVHYGGNMGASVERNVNPMLKKKGLPSVDELKKKYSDWAESGSPDYMWSIVFKKPTAGLVYLKPEVVFDDVIEAIVSGIDRDVLELFGNWAAQNRMDLANAANDKFSSASRLITAIAKAAPKE